jgi:ABC-type multidrug transport system permease subunit
MVRLLQNEDLSELMAITEMDSPGEARALVDGQRAGVAIIIPPDLSRTLFDPEGSMAVEFYQDPTLTIGPSIVKAVIDQFIDSFAGSRIATDVIQQQLQDSGITVDPQRLNQIRAEYGAWAASIGQEMQEQNTHPYLEIQSVAEEKEKSVSQTTLMLTSIMAGMLVFYTFFTGASAAQTLLREEEEGTLPRLFTTPTRQSTILVGKFVAVVATLAVQVTTLIVLSTLIFGVNWGQALPVALVSLGLVALAASFGIFVNSLLKSTKQSGVVQGGVMNILGWVGISRMFVNTVPGTQKVAGIANIVSLISPHGWAMWGWQEAMDGGSTSTVLLIVGVMLAMSAVLMGIGIYRFYKRFA